MKRILFASLGLILLFSSAAARTTSKGNNPANAKPRIEVKGAVSDYEINPIQVETAHDTTWLAYYTFDVWPAACVEQGWTSHDMTAQIADFFHVDDFSDCGPGTYGRLYAPQGDQALWCGFCPSTADPYCGYATLPGYGNNWDQAFCSPCVATADTMVTVDYLVVWDSEPGYDGTYLEYDHCDGVWNEEGSINGGAGVYEGVGAGFESINIPQDGAVSLRFHFTSDIAWSDEDGKWDTDGAIIIDSLTITDAFGVLVATEDFEDETVGDTDATDWQSCTPPGYGDLAQLIRAFPTTYQNDPVEEDPCAANFTCLWNFVKGSSANYACNIPNPSPQQLAIPYPNARNQYIHNEIWSPWILLSGTGSIVNLEFDVYRDLEYDVLIFYVWHVSTKDANGSNCASPWRDRTEFYYGGGKDWYRSVESLGDLIPAGTTHIRIALGVFDMCQVWCPAYYAGCHSHAPMFDNVGVYRVAAPGPQFSVRDIDMFQDNFSADGTITGTARADMAQDILPYSSPSILPGDSVCITVDDPEVGLAGDAFTGCGPAVYCYISVDPAQYAPLAKQAPEMRAGCGTRFPHVNTTSWAGRTWDVFRMDSCFASNGGLVADRYCIDFNDNLFVPGDTCWFFFETKNTSGVSNFFSMPYGQTTSPNLAAKYSDEFTILPAVGDEPGNDILYVDGMNFRGAQPYFDTAFQNMNLLVDRYDVRGPDSGVGNRPGSRVTNVLNQMIGVYRKVLWNTGDLRLGCLGDGVGYEKSDDATMLFNWIDQMPNEGGIYFSGDDIASEWAYLTGPGAIALRSYCNYTVVSPNHVFHGVGICPTVRGVPGPNQIFVHGGVPDSMVAFGGCPLINDFDVLANTPGVSDLQMEYIEAPDRAPCGPTTGGAIVSQTTTNSAGYDVTIILSGFSFHFIRDIDEDGILDRFHHLYVVITTLKNIIDATVPVLPEPSTNSLSQNYPNPFNPRTTIKYTIKERGLISLRIYNVAGQLVKTLVNQKQKPEEVKPIEWDGLNNAGQQVSSGVYFYKLVTRNYTQTRKMVLLK